MSKNYLQTDGRTEQNIRNLTKKLKLSKLKKVELNFERI